MVDRHIDERQLQGYVEGDLDAFSTAALERHVEHCRACALRLTEAARLEVAMFEAAAVAATEAPRRRTRIDRSDLLGRGAAVMLGMAATVLLTLMQPGLQTTPHWQNDEQMLAVQSGRFDALACIPPAIHDDPKVCDDILFVAGDLGDAPWTPLDPVEAQPGTRCVPSPDGFSLVCTSEPASG